MNKGELIDVVASRIDASKKDAGVAVQAVVDAITETVAKGQKVSISGFGVFETVARPARTYRKPNTGEAIRKLSTSVPRFRPGGDFKAFVSGEKNIAEKAVQAARGAGDDVLGAAGSVVRKVTGKAESAPEPAAAEPTAPVAKKAPAKKAPAKKAPAKRAAAKKTTAAAGTAAKKAATTTGAAAKKAPTKRASTTKAAAAEAAPDAPTAP